MLATRCKTLYRWLHGGYMSPAKEKARYRFDSALSLCTGGEGGIRTHGDIATTPDFESDKIYIPQC